ncbi:MAG: helix-turn-helix transcriptional regulator [Gammaproteobacteria bacterium]
MPKSPQALLSMPPAAAAALRSLGENLAVARVRRRESQRAWARRLGVSVPTLIRMERGDPGVGVGIYATALWLMGRVNALPDVAAPAEDQGALESDVREALKRRAVRSAASIEARLGRAKGQRKDDGKGQTKGKLSG